MASSWFLILHKCIDFLSWPVLALGYPLYASIEAIENDSHSDTRNLISYWILLSLIYIFEHAFLKLLQWFRYWHYMKLMIVVFLMTPDFGRAAYIYNHLIRSCIYMNPQAVISRIRTLKNVFVKKEDFMMQVQNYITQNGTEELEKLIASKNSEQSMHVETRKAAPKTTEKNNVLKNTEQNLDQEVPTTEKNETQQNTAQSLDPKTRKTVPPTIEKNEAQQTDKVRLPLEQEDIKDLEMIEKEKVPCGKPEVNTALWSLKSNENTLSNIAKTEGMVEKYTAGKASPHISASKNFQKEWICALCQVTTTSESDMNSHLHGRLHKAACEALKAKNMSAAVKVFVKKNDKLGGEPEKMINALNSLEQKITTYHHPKIEQKNVEIVNGRKGYYRPKRTIDQENVSTSFHVI